MKKFGSIIIIFLLSNAALAEYRVYQYYVKSVYDFPNKKNAYIVTSTLSPTSYLAYHGSNASIKLNLMQTWMCKGNTAYNEICNGPTVFAPIANKGETL